MTPKLGTECQVLGSNEEVCKNKPYKLVKYHGDHEIYNTFAEDGSTWVRVTFCKKHYEAMK